MIPIFRIPDSPASAAAHRKFRTWVGILFVVAVIVLVLQYTSHALLAERKTSSMWGVITGIVVMFLFIEWRWSRSRGRPA